MKVRIKTPPYEREMDGLTLEGFQPGSVRDVSPALGTWLVVKGYAEPEMRDPNRQSRVEGFSDRGGGFVERRKHPR